MRTTELLCLLDEVDSDKVLQLILILSMNTNNDFHS